jgi:predicted enzyme related to lactoylglutathione lyase
VNAAKAFYRDLFGWTLEDVRPGGTDYTLAKLGGQEIGGIMAIRPHAAGTRPAWGSYVAVGDVDAITRRVEQLGGRICLAPQDIPGVGRLAMIEDPQGAMLSLISHFNER